MIVATGAQMAARTPDADDRIATAATSDGRLFAPAEDTPLTAVLASDSLATRYTTGLARGIHTDPAAITNSVAKARYQTPLRYPGAKTGLAPVIGELLHAASRHRSLRDIDLLVEPFAGGASTSLRLVGDGTVRRVLLADADPLVAAFWQVAASETDELIARMRAEHEQYIAPGTAEAVQRWDYWRAWSPPAGTRPSTSRFESAVKCLYLNRTTFSGILHGRAGPIGGRSQTSDYSIGCRFNPDALADRISYVGHLYDTGRLIDVWCMDWRDTLENTASVYKTLVPNHVVAYLDPPYLRKSAKLYNTSFDEGTHSPRTVPAPAGWPNALAHEQLARYLTSKMRYRWILSYDYHPELLASFLLYGRDRMNPSDGARAEGIKQWRISKRIVRLTYTAAARSSRDGADELLLTTLPPSAVPTNDLIRAIGSLTR
ncbi:DNA adenine methylase [Blastococcus sp. KM273128]|uniref:DNA adenine methylase n=1 Tax=Blastococcus sp. KM273128 TaxID=2570314 RepID=UPI001F00E88E|nr:DNA adenine methylase [Blastococcus sp. KM273128]MCF6746554.1 DNA adenine methylase [Blastococcus sp. KM273128]